MGLVAGNIDSIDIFPWNEHFNTGLPKIDQQHQKLVQLLNRVASCVAFGSDAETLTTVFEDLEKYAVYHFRTEEEIWRRYLPNDALEADHEKAHGNFIEVILKLKGETGSNPTWDLLTFITRWLAAHILQSDRHLSMIVRALQSGLSLEQAKADAEETLRRTKGIFVEIILSAYYGLSTSALQLMKKISESKQTEHELRIAAAAFEAQEGIIVTDADTVTLRVNQAFCRMTGYASEEIVGLKPSMLKSGYHDEVFYRDMWDSIRREQFWQGEIWNRCKDGEVRPHWATFTAVKSADGQVANYVAYYSDISQHKKDQDAIHSLAYFDPLTTLPNRRLLLDRIAHALTSSARSARHGALLFIDLDDFKTINDTLGHAIGDQLLQQVSARLAGSVREGDTVARLGGDEFVVMLEDLSESAMVAATQTEAVGEKVLAALNQTYPLGGSEHHSTPSIGIILFQGQEVGTDELLKRADVAMYQAKAAGRNTLRFFDPEMQAVVDRRAALEADLRSALQKKQFRLHYQAQVVADGGVTGAEALVRWLHPERGMVSPAEFIPLAEETGLILPLGEWVLETACNQLAIWATKPETADLSLAVNVSAKQFRHKNFVTTVLAILERSGANPHCLKLELTESILVENVEDIIAKMAVLRAEGISFSLDDFGTGYSSLAYLKRLPLDQLKIDQSFVRGVLSDPNDATIAKMVIALSKSMGLTVIAEGVEAGGQRDFLAGHGCHAYQGYLFSRPLPSDEFASFMEREPASAGLPFLGRVLA